MAKPDLSQYIEAAAQRNNVDPALVMAVISHESNGNPSAFNAAGGGQGAVGAMQVRQGALADYNKANGTKYTMSDLKKPGIGIDVGTWYLGQQLDRFGDPQKALVAYNEGAGSPTVATQGSSQYSQAVLSRMNGPNQQGAPKMLPGIPGASQSAAKQSDDDILAQFTKGAPPSAASNSAANPDSDDAILSRFTKTAPAQAAAVQSTPNAPQPQAEQPGNLISAAAGAGRGFGNIVLGAQQFLGRGLKAYSGAVNAPATGRLADWLINDADSGVKKLADENAPYANAHPIANAVGDFAGSAVATAPLASAKAASSLFGLAKQGAKMGGLAGLVSPVEESAGTDQATYWKQKAQQGAIGAAAGAGSAGLIGLASRAISPKLAPEVQMLMDKGVTPTPGQILGGGFARTEEKLSSMPFLGDMIKNAQGRALNDFNRAIYNDVLEPLGKSYSGPVGQAGVASVKQTIGDAYDKALSKMTFTADPKFQSEVVNLSNMAQSLPDSQAKTFANILRTQILGKLGPQGTMDGEALKGVQSELRKASKGYLGDASYDARQLGAAVQELSNSVDSALKRTNPPELSKQLDNANEAYAKYVRLRSAAASTGAANNEGLFTPAQLMSAVRSSDKSVGKGAFATGNAYMQDLASAGQTVLGKKYPDSGTVGRGLLSLFASGSTAGLMSAPIPTLVTLGSLGAGSLPYTRVGQSLAAKLLGERPVASKPIADLVTKAGLLAVPGSISMGVNQ